MSNDLTPILDGWEHNPDHFAVRIIRGNDGRDKIQVRLDLGLLQMEIDGRPDGQRPEGQESWFDLFRHRQKEHDQAHPDGASFQLTADECQLLLREGVQYYHRYLSFWHLERYELCARDTSRNLKLFAFVREFAAKDQDRLLFDQYRPYVTMMHTKAVATPLAELGDYEAAIKVIDAGITGIRKFLGEYEQLDRADRCGELMHLEKWREQMVNRQPALPPPPPDPLDQLKADLQQAIAEEQFEEAARLRDELRRRSPEPNL
ncbi:MAG TPA: UvrB/UvrC motif-containing protein [Pirellulales bacterium]|nr:UvrB/UvrC motif-containing protein [Pirellulales bacterium]